MTTVAANLASTRIQKFVTKMMKVTPGLKDVFVDASPIGETTIQMSFLISSGVFTEEEKSTMRHFVQNGVKANIQEIVLHILGWSHIRIRTCPRHKDQSRYTWFIEQR